MNNKNQIKTANKSNLANTEVENVANIARIASSPEKTREAKLKQETEDILSNTPTIPEHVHENLPNFLKDCVSHFSTQREKDVLLTSAIGVISGLFKNLEGEYGDKWVKSNLFVFILAPAANGKGIMEFSYKLGEFHDKMLLQKNKELLQGYQAKLGRFERSKKIESEECPEKPEFKLLYIPANCSSTKLLTHINENEGRGIMFETEADTLGNMFGKEWAVTGEIFRKTFQQEPISISRSTNDVFIQNTKSFMAIVLSGTPNQIHKIIPNAEDGLFSRFIFYIYKTTSGWQSQRPNPNRPNLTEVFNKKGAEIDQMIAFFNENPSKITLHQEQWDKKDELFIELDKTIADSGLSHADSTVKRMGLIFFRFCMIFTALRKFEANNKSPTMQCSDIDFNNAVDLIKIYLEHNLTLLGNLQNSPKFHFNKLPENIQQIFNQMPKHFGRKEIIEKAKELSVPVRTTDYYLNKGKGAWLKSEKTGEYSQLHLEK